MLWISYGQMKYHISYFKTWIEFDLINAEHLYDPLSTHQQEKKKNLIFNRINAIYYYAFNRSWKFQKI